MKHRYKTLIKDTAIFAAGSIASKAIMFFLVPFYTSHLSAADYGIADYIFTIAQMIMPFASVVIFDAVIRFGIQRQDRPQDVLLIGLIIWFLGSAVVFLLAPLLGLYPAVSRWRWYISAYVSLNMLLSINLNYLKAIEKNGLYAVICVTETLLLALANIYFLAFRELGVQGYVLAYLLANAICIALSAIFGGLVPALRQARFEKKLAVEMVRYSSPLIFNNISWWVIQSSDKVMIEEMVSDTALGLYNVAAKMPSLISVFVTVFQQAWGISSSREMDSTNDSSFFTTVFELYCFAAFSACVFLTAIAKIFMHIYVPGAEYASAWQYVPLLLVSAVFSAIGGYCGGLYGALKKSVNNMLSTVTAAAVNLIVNYIAIKMCGLWGAIIGTVVAYIFLGLYRLFDVKRFVQIDADWNRFFINGAIILLQAILVSLQVFGYFVSAAAVVLFAVVNWKYILRMVSQFHLRRK
ncbi:MAG: oligosaccharide flippase family protein [Oscillospiraceae bacterium]|nr:oligosaccharide flippase family protein [Oscillospiraceae bacterium]